MQTRGSYNIVLQNIHHAPEEGKEPYGPACRDYFWLISRLVDSIPPDLVKGKLIFILFSLIYF